MEHIKRNIAIVCGGDSSEHDVSLRSAQGLYSFFDKERYNVYIVDVKGVDWHVDLGDGTTARIDRNDFSFLKDGKAVLFDYAYITIHGTPGENGLLQGSGFPPCARLLTHWIPPKELATKMSIWNCSHSIGAALAVIVCGYLMGTLGTNLSADAAVVSRITANLTENGVANAAAQALEYAGHVGAWKWCFWIPACMAVAGALMIFAGLRDEPKDVKLPDLPDTGLGTYSEKMGRKARRR